MTQQDIPTDTPLPPDFEKIPAIDPDVPHWGPFSGLAVWAASVAAVIFLPAIFLLPYFLASGKQIGTAEELAEFTIKDPGAIIAQMAAIIPAHLLTLVLSWIVITRFGREPFFATLGWHKGGMKPWHYLLLLIGFIILVASVTSIFPLKEDDLERIIRSSRTALYIVAAMAVLTAPLVEEVVYRGVLYSGFRKKFGVATAVVVVTFLFTVVHVPQYLENPAKIGILASLSLALTLLRAYTGSLLPSFILHTLINGIQAVVLIAEPYLRRFETTLPEITSLAK